MSRRELDLDRALADLAASLEFPPTPRPGRRRHCQAGPAPGGGARAAARRPGAGGGWAA